MGCWGGRLLTPFLVAPRAAGRRTGLTRADSKTGRLLTLRQAQGRQRAALINPTRTASVASMEGVGNPRKNLLPRVPREPNPPRKPSEPREPREPYQPKEPKKRLYPNKASRGAVRNFPSRTTPKLDRLEMRQRGEASKVFLDDVLDRIPSDGADDLLLHATVLEQQQGRDAADSVLGRG